MIILDNYKIDENIFKAEFVCHLEKCKGGCCVEGDAGAPLAEKELKEIKKAYKAIAHELSEEAKTEIARVGIYERDDFFGDVTPTINGGICVYGFHDEQGVVKCLFEKAYQEGRTTWPKPMSCHLFPIKEWEGDVFTHIEYEPRKTLCSPACAYGESLGVKVYEFLKEPLIRKYGVDFYEKLDAYAKFSAKPKTK
jgi:hypothetical protein